MTTFKKIAIAVFGFSMVVLFAVSLDTDEKMKKIYGTVTDADQNPLSEVLVVLKGTNNKTSTDNNGQFEIDIPVSASTIIFLKKGMKTAGADVGFPDQVDIRMVSIESNKLSDMALEDLVELKISNVSSKILSSLK